MRLFLIISQFLILISIVAFVLPIGGWVLAQLGVATAAWLIKFIVGIVFLEIFGHVIILIIWIVVLIFISIFFLLINLF